MSARGMTIDPEQARPGAVELARPARREFRVKLRVAPRGAGVPARSLRRRRFSEPRRFASCRTVSWRTAPVVEREILDHSATRTEEQAVHRSKRRDLYPILGR